jgi:predicted transcriptional regulator
MDGSGDGLNGLNGLTTPATQEQDGWQKRIEQRTEETYQVSLETLQRTNQALELQARRMNELARIHQDHTRAWEETLMQLVELMKTLRESIAGADQARTELVSVTAALVKIAQVAQAQIEALQAEAEEE